MTARPGGDAEHLILVGAQAVADFMADGRRQALADERDRVVARTEVIDVRLVGGDPGG